MRFRKFRADQLFDGYTFREATAVLITDREGVVQDIVPESEAGDEIAYVEGILSPGFINCHCHLELSHLKNVIPPHTGLIDFLCSVVTKRGFDPAFIQLEIVRAEKEMYENGIVAVGDIGNTADTARVKSSSRIRWSNFVEVLGFTDAKAAENLAHYSHIKELMTEQLKRSPLPHQSSLVPHAPYSISPLTFQLINKATAGQVISIHNQEHPAEDELYQKGGGDYLRLFKIFGINESPFPVTGKSSLRSYLPYFTLGQTLILVHNTFTTEEDIIWANAFAAEQGIKLVYCFCVNANLYIENRTPAIENFINQHCHIVMGTDSYSSNWQLSMAKEVQAIKKHFPHLPLADLLQWSTSNGAKALQWDDALGSFEKGKMPGIIRISHDLSVSERIL